MNVPNIQQQSGGAAPKSLDKSLSPEIHLLIFERIDGAVTSACLGLTCKAFHAIHQVQCGMVPLKKSTNYGPDNKHFTNLALLLKNWVPSNLAYDYKAGKFVQHTTLARRFVTWEEDEDRCTWLLRQQGREIQQLTASHNDVVKHLVEMEQDLQRCLKYIGNLEEQLEELKKKSAYRERELERERDWEDGRF